MKMRFKSILIVVLLPLFFAFYVIESFAFGSEPKNINILMPAPFAESTGTIIKQFNQDHKGNINVHVTKGPKETEAVSDLAISSLLLGNTPYDIVLIDVTWLPKYVAADWLEPLDKWIDSNKWNELASGAKLGNSYKGNIYRWPLTADIGLLYWRTDLMNKPPKTPEELIEISNNLISTNLVPYGYVWQGRQYEGLSCVFLEVLEGFGGAWIDNENNVQLNSPESIKATKWLNRLITSGASPISVANFSENEALQIFKSGDAALMRNWPYAFSELQKENSTVKDKVAITTMVSNTNQESVATLGSWGLSILNDSANKKESMEVINFLTSYESQKQLFLKSGYTPTSTALFTDSEILKASPNITELKRALDFTKTRPETPLYAQISNVLQKQLNAVLTGNKSAEEAMQLAQNKSEKILLSAGR